MDESASLSLLLLFAETAALPEAPTLISTLLNLLLVIFLVLANGFFVASEFALVAVRKSRIEALAAEGNKAALRLLDLLNNLSAYISATQLGITLASLGLGWVGEPAVAAVLEPILMRLGEATGMAFLASGAVLHTISFAIAFSFITFLHIVFGELAPKTAALELSERVSMVVALPLQIFYKVFSYPIRLLDWTGTKTVRLFGLHPSGEHGSSYTEDEIRQLINISEQSGHLNREERRLINRVFEFSETTVKEAMIPRTEIIAVSDDCTLEEIARAFRQYAYSRLPVYHGSLDNIVGFIHSKDLMPFLAASEIFQARKGRAKSRFTLSIRRGSKTFCGRCRERNFTSDLSLTNTAASRELSRSKTCSKKSSVIFLTSTTKKSTSRFKKEADGACRSTAAWRCAI